MFFGSMSFVEGPNVTYSFDFLCHLVICEEVFHWQLYHIFFDKEDREKL